jgi:DNA-binding MarR family transcriptional regulator
MMARKGEHPARDARPPTTRLIDRLERAGFVRRVADPADRRKVIVEPVPDAGARIEEVVAPARGPSDLLQ